MKYFRLLGPVLIVALTLCAVASTVAHANEGEGPDYAVEGERLEEGETLKVQATTKGSFTLTAGTDAITCKGMGFNSGATIDGSTGPNASKSNELVEYTKCSVTGNGSGCAVEGEKITTAPVASTLGFGNSSKSGPILLLLEPETGKPLRASNLRANHAKSLLHSWKAPSSAKSSRRPKSSK
jgi:hypothetical protein